MLLVVQIALGIVLGFLLIQHHRQIGHGIWLLLLLLVGIAIGVFFVWVGSEFISSVTENDAFPRMWRGLTSMIIPVVVICIVAAGGLGLQFLVQILRKPTPKKPDDESNWPILFYSFVNCFLVTIVYYGLAVFTPLGVIGDAIDSYGRANGWQDGLTILSFAAATLWPWAALLAVIKFLKSRPIVTVRD